MLKRMVCALIISLLSISCDNSSMTARIGYETPINKLSADSLYQNELDRRLCRAAQTGDREKIREAVNRGANVNALGNHGYPPAYCALRKSSIDGLAELLSLGADPNLKWGSGGTALFAATKIDNNAFTAQLLAHGADPNMVGDAMGSTPLFNAVGPYGKDSLPLLLEAGADIEARISKGYTPLLMAAMNNQFDSVYLLLESGADFSVRNHNDHDLQFYIKRGERMDKASTNEAWRQKVIKWLAAKDFFN